MRFYKGKYLIGIYDEDDVLLCACTDVNEFAKYSGMDIKQALISVGKIYAKKQSSIKINNKKCKLYFIPMTAYEMEELKNDQR